MQEHKPGESGAVNDLFQLIWSSRVLVASIIALSALLSISYSLLLPNIYQSSALLSPVEETNGGLLSQYSGFASIAGVSLPGVGEVSKAELALEVLKSRAFIKEFINRHSILPEIFAVDYWDPSQRALIIDSEIYNEKNQEWLRYAAASRTKVPTEQEAYKRFSQLMGVKKDKLTSLVTLSIKHQSPDIARQWVDWLVEDVNETMRKIDITEARQSIDYLEKQALENSVSDLDRVFFELMQAQMQKMMLAEVRREYALRTIDPAVAPELKAEPQRALICILGVLFGSMIGVLIPIVRYYILNRDVKIKRLD